MRSAFLVLTAALLTTAPACSGGDTDDDGGGAPAADAGYGASWTVEWGPVEVPPLTEDTRCVVKRLGNDRPIKVGRFINDLGDASHHLIVYRLSEGQEMAEPFRCDPFQDVLDPTKGAPLAITQRSSETISLPAGVGYSLEQDQLVRLEMHYLNSSETAKTVTATSTFIEIPDADFQHEADFLFVGNPDINIPPMSPWTLGPSYLPVPADLLDINIFAITGHQHALGTGVEVALADSVDGPDTTVYAPDPFLWNEPDTVYHDPPLTVNPAGGFRFACHYVNTTNQTVKFGESTNQEMCFFWAYYYPSRGAKVCVHSDEYNVDLCCPGNALCALLDL
jgi:hypothetical protein